MEELSLTIFDRLRSMQREHGLSLYALIGEACDVGNGLVSSLDPVNVREAATTLISDGHGLLGGLLIVMADKQDRALAAAYRKPNGNGHSQRRSA
jgi:hypothetical protein